MARAYAAVARLARRGPGSGVGAFLAAQAHREGHRPWALGALAWVRTAEGDRAGAREAAAALAAEYGGSEHGLMGYASLHALAVAEGDAAAGLAALGAAEAGWPEAEAVGAMRRERALRFGEGPESGARAAGGDVVAARAGGGPAAFTLGPAYPNPSRGAVTLPLVLAEAAVVSAGVYDVLGRRVAVLAEGELEAGTHALRLGAGALPAGVYVVRATVHAADGAARTPHRRVTLVR